MEIVVVGINHKKSPVEIREKVSFTPEDIKRAYHRLSQNHYIKELVILSTCNRSEITAVVTDMEKGIKTLKEFYYSFFQIPEGALEEYFFVNSSDDGVKHVFRLAAGLDSLILGEDQILGQVRQAHEAALNHKSTSTLLNKLYREAITVAKKIKRETALSGNPLSISSIAIKFMEHRFTDLKDKAVLVIGVGEMSRIAIENLLYKNVKEIYVTNRTKGHAVDLSKRYEGIGVIDFKDRYKMLSQVDIVLTSTGAPHYILKKDEFEKYRDSGKPLCIVDIALPRDVDPDIGNVDGVDLYELDQLKQVAMDNMGSRLDAAEDAMEIIIEECVKFENWYHCLPVFPVIEEIKEYSEEIFQEELSSLLKRLETASQKDRELIEIVMKSLAKKLIKRPILNLKIAGENRQGQLYARIASELFALNDFACRKRRK